MEVISGKPLLQACAEEEDEWPLLGGWDKEVGTRVLGREQVSV